MSVNPSVNLNVNNVNIDTSGIGNKKTAGKITISYKDEKIDIIAKKELKTIDWLYNKVRSFVNKNEWVAVKIPTNSNGNKAKETTVFLNVASLSKQFYQDQNLIRKELSGSSLNLNPMFKKQEMRKNNCNDVREIAKSAKMITKEINGEELKLSQIAYTDFITRRPNRLVINGKEKYVNEKQVPENLSAKEEIPFREEIQLNRYEELKKDIPNELLRNNIFSVLQQQLSAGAQETIQNTIFKDEIEKSDSQDIPQIKQDENNYAIEIKDNSVKLSVEFFAHTENKFIKVVREVIIPLDEINKDISSLEKNEIFPNAISITKFSEKQNSLEKARKAEVKELVPEPVKKEVE